MLGRSTQLRRFSKFVPQYQPPDQSDITQFYTFLDNYHKIVILTGAGVSTESGIPDYRSEEVGVFARTSYKPILYRDFIKNEDARRRYWARNFVGWPRFKSFSPNINHSFVADIQAQKLDTRLITQNVDGLHSKAGSRQVLELHGNAYWVRCINCQHTISRSEFQTILEQKNTATSDSFGEIRPDGDVEIPEENIKNFEVPPCENCGGILKPTIVFFGQNVPEATAKEAEKLVDECEGMLILGTSLSTLSTYRLVEKAYDACKFLCMVNIGETRADKMMDLKISTKISDMIQFTNDKDRF